MPIWEGARDCGERALSSPPEDGQHLPTDETIEGAYRVVQRELSDPGAQPLLGSGSKERGY